MGPGIALRTHDGLLRGDLFKWGQFAASFGIVQIVESLPRRHALPPHAACARFLCVAASTPLYIFAPMTNIVSGNMAEVTDDRVTVPRLTKKQLVVMDTKLGEKIFTGCLRAR